MKGEEKLGIFEIISLIIGIIGILALFVLYFLTKKREKEAFRTKVKSEIGRFEKSWREFEEWIDAVDKTYITETIKDIRKISEEFMELSTKCPPEIPDEIISKIQNIGIDIKNLGTYASKEEDYDGALEEGQDIIEGLKELKKEVESL